MKILQEFIARHRNSNIILIFNLNLSGIFNSDRSFLTFRGQIFLDNDHCPRQCCIIEQSCGKPTVGSTNIVSMSKTECENLFLQFLLFVFNSKYSQKSTQSTQNIKWNKLNMFFSKICVPK